MSKKGYGNVNPRFAKYFARHKNSSGAHDPKNAKQQAQAEQAIEYLHQTLEELYEAGPALDLGVNDWVRVRGGDYDGNEGRIVIRRLDLQTEKIMFGVVFAWDTSSIPRYFERKELERAND